MVKMVGEKMKQDTMVRLVERAKQGNEEAFAQLYNQFSKSIYYMGLRITQNAEAANDILRDTMITLHKNLHTIDSTETLAAYVNRIANSRSIDYLRKNKPLQVEDDSDLTLNNIPDEDDDFIPEEYLSQKEQRAYVVNLINELSDPQRTVIMLYYYGQLSIKQISESLRVEEAAVKMRLSRARSILKQKLEVTTTMKGQVIGIMPASILTQILEAEANDAFTAEISTSIWHNIAGDLGYVSETISATTATATACTTASTTATTGAGAAAVAGTTATAGGAASILTAAIATTCAAAVITGGVYFYQTAVEQPPYIPEPVVEYYDITYGDTVGDDIELSAIGIAETDASLEALSNPTDASNIYGDDAGATTPATPLIAVNNWEIHYSAGVPVTPQQVISDAGVTILEVDERRLSIQLEHFWDINFEEPGNYPIFAYAVDQHGTRLDRVVIIIYID